MASSASTLRDPQPADKSPMSSLPNNSSNEQEQNLVEPFNEEDVSKSAEQFYLEKNNNMKVLVAMCIGLDNGSDGIFGETGDLEDNSRFPKRKKTMWKPSCKRHLVEEIKRRKIQYYKNKYEDSPIVILKSQWEKISR